MIHWLLLILKIIGILIGSILGLLLFLILLVVFAPVRYKGRVTYGPQPLSVKAGISWLLFVLRVKITYFEKKVLFVVSLFGIPVYRSDREQKEQKPAEKRKKERKRQGKKMVADTEKAKPLPKTVSVTPENPAEQEAAPQGIHAVEDSPAEVSKKTNIFKRISDKIRKIRETINNIVQKVKTLLHQVDAVKELLGKEESKRAIAFVFREFGHLLKHILPRKISGSVVYGSGDPCSTGQALGIVSILYAKFGPLLSITPDFEEKRLLCDVAVKGKIQVFTLLRIALKVLFHKEIKQLIKEFKQLKTAE